MWILVIGREGLEEREGSAVACLHELGCEVQTANLWDRLDTEELVTNPPTVVLIEAGDEGDAGRAALVRVRAAEPLQEVPVIIGVTVNAVTRLDAGDGFDDFALMPYVPAELYSGSVASSGAAATSHSKSGSRWGRSASIWPPTRSRSTAGIAS